MAKRPWLVICIPRSPTAVLVFVLCQKNECIKLTFWLKYFVYLNFGNVILVFSYKESKDLNRKGKLRIFQTPALTPAHKSGLHGQLEEKCTYHFHMHQNVPKLSKRRNIYMHATLPRSFTNKNKKKSTVSAQNQYCITSGRETEYVSYFETNSLFESPHLSDSDLQTVEPHMSTDFFSTSAILHEFVLIRSIAIAWIMNRW
jgi:hypothetical protein